MLIERFAQSPVGVLVPTSGFDPRFREDYSHFAFVPHPLPERVALTDETWTLVSDAMLSLGRLDQAGRQLPNPALLRRPTIRREAQSTSALEGTYAPLTQVLEADPDDASPRSPELTEVLNYVRAAEHAFRAIVDRPLTTQLVLELHRLLVQLTPSDGSEAGHVRTHQVVIGAAATRVGEARFVPPPPGPGLETALQDWVQWVGARRPHMPTVVAAALAHYHFETLHPFNDGNGRIGRLLIVVQLLAQGTIREPLLTVSPWFEARRTAYQDELQRVSESGDWDRWVRFFCTAIRDQADDSIRKVNDLIGVHDRARETCRVNRVRGLALDVAEALIERPVLTPSWVQKHYGVSYPAANSAVAKLEQLGLLRETTGGNYGRLFANDEVLEILESRGPR